MGETPTARLVRRLWAEGSFSVHEDHGLGQGDGIVFPVEFPRDELAVLARHVPEVAAWLDTLPRRRPGFLPTGVSPARQAVILAALAEGDATVRELTERFEPAIHRNLVDQEMRALVDDGLVERADRLRRPGGGVVFTWRLTEKGRARG